MTVVKNNASQILEEYLDEHGIKKSFVAEKAGMSPSWISDRLTGRLKFTADFAITVARVLQVSPSLFLKENYSNRIKEKSK